MKPEAETLHVLSTVRATAKMHEFRAAPEDFIHLERDPKTLFAIAVGILGDVAAAIADNFVDWHSFDPRVGEERPKGWDEEDGSPHELVRFSATFFDAYLEARLEEEITAEFSLLCASAYYLADSVGSAAVVARNGEPPALHLGHGLARVAYALLRNEFGKIEGDFPHWAFAGRLLAAMRNYFALDGEAEEIITLCRDVREAAYDNGSARELLYADVVTAICARKLRNSARNLLPPASGLQLDAWAPAMAKLHFPVELWPAQQRICDRNLLRGRSAIIQMPTSAGKTRATELIIRAAFLSGRASLAVIVAPFRSLCHDIRGDLAKAFAGEPIVLDEVSDSYLLDVDIAGMLARDTVLIITPEKLLYMLRREPQLAERIGIVIYDEGHQFEGMARGPTYELLLSSLRMTLRPDTQVVLISAVIGNASEVAGWLVRDPDAVVDGKGLLPTAKNIAFASWQHQRGWLQYVKPDDPDDVEFFVPRIINVLTLARKHGERVDRVFPVRNQPQKFSESSEVALYLGLHLVPNGSVAVFCGQKVSVTKLCRRAVEIFDRQVPLPRPLEVSDTAEVVKIAALSGRHLGEGSDATQAAQLGIFGHHANTPHGLRLSIEHAMKVGHAKFVICTSTLAQGVNFPIKYLIVTVTQQGREKIKVRDFHNLIGRAGRAGMHTEGSVIFSAPALFDEHEDEDSGSWRWTKVKELLDPANAEPCTSSILDLFKPYEQTRPPISLEMPAGWLDLAFSDRAAIDALVAAALRFEPRTSASEFRAFALGRARAVQNIAAYLAAHVQFDDENALNRVNELAANTLAYHLADEETRAKLLEVFQLTAQAIRNNTDADFRALFRRSPLPPADILDLGEWLRANLDLLRQAAARGELLEAVFGRLMPYISAKSISSLSDQNVVLPSLRSWISGEAFREIHQTLTNARIRVGRDHITIEHVVELCEKAFAYELAMLVASLADLLEPLDDDLHESILSFQKWIKCGLDDVASISFYEAGFADRVVATALGTAFPGATNRAGVRNVCRRRPEEINRLLDAFPAYFRTVADELRA